MTYDSPLTSGVCALCGDAYIHHSPYFPPTPGKPICLRYLDRHVLCGCDCRCTRRLRDGNVMTVDVTRDPRTVQDPDTVRYRHTASGVRAELLICLNCYVGEHSQA